MCIIVYSTPSRPVFIARTELSTASCFTSWQSTLNCFPVPADTGYFRSPKQYTYQHNSLWNNSHRNSQAKQLNQMIHSPSNNISVCMDEKLYQLLGDAREPLPMRPGDDQKTDSEYIRNGTCSIFAFVEPLGGTHHVSIREHMTAFDRAEEIKYLVDTMYPHAEKIVLVMDNPNTHRPASLDKNILRRKRGE